jgi:hypothetical protein
MHGKRRRLRSHRDRRHLQQRDGRGCVPIRRTLNGDLVGQRGLQNRLLCLRLTDRRRGRRRQSGSRHRHPERAVRHRCLRLRLGLRRLSGGLFDRKSGVFRRSRRRRRRYVGDLRIEQDRRAGRGVGPLREQRRKQTDGIASRGSERGKTENRGRARGERRYRCALCHYLHLLSRQFYLPALSGRMRRVFRGKSSIFFIPAESAPGDAL